MSSPYERTLVKRHRFLRLLLAVAAATLTSMGAASPVFAETFSYPIENYGNGKCLQPKDGSMEPGVAIVQEPCDGSRAQDWGFVRLSGTTFRLLNHQTGRCMDARGSATNGTPVVQWDCATITNETWDTGRYLPDIVSLKSRVSGTNSHCLDVAEQQTADGLPMQLWSCNGTVAQTWLIGIGIIVQA